MADDVLVLRTELREVARLRSLESLRTVDLPALYALPCFCPGEPSSPDRLDQLTTCTNAAVELIPAGPYRDAADAIFGFREDRFTALKERMQLAGGAFGVGSEAFRKRRTDDRPSRFEETCDELAGAFIRLPPQPTVDPASAATPLKADTGDGTAGPPAQVSPRAGPASGPQGAPGTTRYQRERQAVRVAAASLVVLAVVAAGALTLFRSTGRGANPAQDQQSIEPAMPRLLDPSGGLDFVPPPWERPVGDPDCDVPPGTVTDGQSSLAPLSGSMTDAFHADGGSETWGCPIGPVEEWGPLGLQLLEIDGQPTGALVGIDAATALILTDAQWGTYSRIGDASGDNAYDIAGYPVDRTAGSHASQVDLSAGVRLIGSTEYGPHYWIPEIVLDKWLELGELGGPLGLPTSNPYVREAGHRQEFEGGFLELTSSGALEEHRISDAASFLPVPLADAAGRILRHADGTSWFIGTDRQRYWIPDGGTWGCLGGWQNVAANEVPGWAIASIPDGGRASCPTSGLMLAGLDVWGWCRAQHGDGSKGEVDEVTGDWHCLDPNGLREPRAVDPAVVCEEQVGTETEAYLDDEDDPYSWHCAYWQD